MSQFQKNIIITSIGHFLVHAMMMILPAVLVLLEAEFSVSLISLGRLVTIQILFLGGCFFYNIFRESELSLIREVIFSYALIVYGLTDLMIVFCFSNLNCP